MVITEAELRKYDLEQLKAFLVSNEIDPGTVDQDDPNAILDFLLAEFGE